MRLCHTASALLTLVSGIAQTHAFGNATASPPSLGTFSSTENRARTFVAEPSSARDEERAIGNEGTGWEHHLATFVAKSVQALWKQDAESQLQAKIALWRLTNAHPHFAFSKLKLNEVGEDILSNSRFREWVKYVKSYNSEHRNNKVSIVEILRQRYGDLKLAVMLIHAQKDADTSLNDFATELQTELMLHQWRPESSDPHSLYTDLELDMVNRDILSNSWFHAWVDYVENFNLEHPTEKVSVVEKLEKQYGYRILAAMLEEAQNDADTPLQAFATKVQTEMMLYWRDLQIDPRKLFSMLQLDTYFVNLLRDPALKLWKIYVSEYNPGAPVTLFDQLYHSFSGIQLSWLISLAKQSEETSLLATNLQDQLINLWFENGATPELLFKRLRLYRRPTRLPDDRAAEVWMKFCELYRDKKATHVNYNEIIEKFFNADEIKVMISSAETNDGKKLADELKTAEA